MPRKSHVGLMGWEWFILSIGPRWQRWSHNGKSLSLRSESIRRLFCSFTLDCRGMIIFKTLLLCSLSTLLKSQAPFYPNHWYGANSMNGTSSECLILGLCDIIVLEKIIFGTQPHINTIELLLNYWDVNYKKIFSEWKYEKFVSQEQIKSNVVPTVWPEPVKNAGTLAPHFCGFNPFTRECMDPEHLCPGRCMNFQYIFNSRYDCRCLVKDFKARKLVKHDV
uniref:EGF-like domain-containing protein n=1 Tax=Syphacia muris TaxID=451379 RepID=A0A0N5AW55_9BILA